MSLRESKQQKLQKRLKNEILLYFICVTRSERYSGDNGHNKVVADDGHRFPAFQSCVMDENLC